MIDRLELIVPDDVPKRTENWHVQRMRHAKGNSIYAHTLDESQQLALRVHYDFRVPIAKERRHVKVDFTDTRLLSAEDLLLRLRWMFRIGSEQALSFRVARIDLDRKSVV